MLNCYILSLLHASTLYFDKDIMKNISVKKTSISDYLTYTDNNYPYISDPMMLNMPIWNKK